MAMRTLDELNACLDTVRASPRDRGTVELMVVRPGPGERRLVEEGELDVTSGLVGDSWPVRPCKRTPDHSPDPLQQITLMSTRVIAAICERERWALAGDQFFVDFDLSKEHLPAGTQLQLGEALVEITEQPHLGCAKFTERFGSDATKWVNQPLGRELRLRGVNARVLRGGIVRRGDVLLRL